MAEQLASEILIEHYPKGNHQRHRCKLCRCYYDDNEPSFHSKECDFYKISKAILDAEDRRENEHLATMVHNCKCGKYRLAHEESCSACGKRENAELLRGAARKIQNASSVFRQYEKMHYDKGHTGGKSQGKSECRSSTSTRTIPLQPPGAGDDGSGKVISLLILAWVLAWTIFYVSEIFRMTRRETIYEEAARLMSNQPKEKP